MPGRRNEIIRRVHVDPTKAMGIERNPGVRGVRTGKPGAAGRRIGFEIAADVAGGQSERTEAADLQMGEILTDAASMLEDFLQWRRHRRCPGIKLEVVMNPVGE